MKPGVDYVGVTTAFLCNDGQGKFLFAKRSANTRDEQGTWEFGGGQLEYGVDLETNVLREVEEEYGCPGTIQEQLPAFTMFREADAVKTHWICIGFFIKVDPAAVKNNEPHKIDELGWFSLDKLPSPLHSGVQMALQKFEQYFSRYGKE